MNPASYTMEIYTRLWDQLPPDVQAGLVQKGLSPDSLGWRQQIRTGVDWRVVVLLVGVAGGLGWWWGRR